MKTKVLVVGAVLLLLAMALAACTPAATPTPVEEKPCPTAAPCPDCPKCPELPEPVVKEVPFQDAWASSPHNNAEAEAFNHWNEEDPKEVPVTCANCHTTAGYQDFLGGDGSPAGVVDKPVPAPAGTIQCVACHNPAAVALREVTFPYVGKDENGNDVPTVVNSLGDATRCAVCHQGRASKASVDGAIAKFGLTDDPDKVSEPAGDPPSALGFINIHYYAAAATLYGTEVKGGYEYDGKSYDARFHHVEGYNTCIGCHDPHTLEIKIEQCSHCHEGVASVEDIQKIRMISSGTDYDGDGDITEPIKAEIEGLQAMLLTAIQAYAKEKAGVAIAYNPAAYPYWFVDADGDGAVGEAEKDRYATWTARLLKAAYNYQVSVKDPGAFAHNGKYIIELLYDSIEDLNSVISAPVDLSKANRIDHGHFAGSEEAFRHWDTEGEVPAACAKCHSATGLPTFNKEGVNISAEPASGFMCATCHNEANWPALYAFKSVTVPSGKALSFGEEAKDNLCIVCHSGRESKSTMDKALSALNLGDDEVSDKVRFRNIHYFAAAITLFGTEAQGGYEYDGKTYVGKNAHVQGFDTCLGCHDAHTQQVKVEACTACHPVVKGKEDLMKIRISTEDYDGDGDVTEGMAGEVAGVAERLLAAITAYAEGTGNPITYNAYAYPYWFGADGKGYAAFTPKLVKAAFNYQLVMKDPGGFAHNGKYLIQLMYDSIESLGGDLTGLIRP